MKEDKKEFTEEEIRFLPPRDAVRLRTSMYLGSVEKSDVMIREIIDNSCDEISEGFGDTILISNNFNGFCFVADNGRGLPITMSKDKPGITQAELSMSELHSGSKFEGSNTLARIGEHGLGQSAVCFTSNIFIVLSKITEFNYDRTIPPVKELWKNAGPRSKKDLFYILVYEEGLKVFEGAGKLKDLEKKIFKGIKNYVSIPEGQSTITLFKPDPKIWENCTPEIPMTNLQYFLLIQEKFYKKKVNVVVDGVNLRSTFNPYKFEFAKTIVPKDTSSNKQVGLYVTFEVDPNLGNAQVFGSVNGLSVDEGVHINLGKNLYKQSLKSYFGIKHDYLLNGLKMVIIILANEVQYNSQTKENLKQITKVKPTDFDEILKDFQRIFKKNEDYWEVHTNKLNLLAESLKSITAVEKAQKIIDDASGRGIYKAKGDMIEGFADATAGSNDRWNCEMFLCFTGDTEMLTCNDEKITMVDLEERIKTEDIYTFSCKPNGEIIPAKILAAKKIGEVDKICIITLDSGEVIKCTPDHELMLRSGSYKQAKDLIVGDSMMPCYITKTNALKESDKRRVILDMGGGRTDIRPEKGNDFTKAVGGRLIPIYRIMAEHSDTIIDDSSKLPGAKLNRHHIDKNKLNDYPTNLLLCSSEKHSTFHVKDASQAAHKKAHEDINTYNKMYVFNKQTDEFRQYTSNRFKKLYNSEEGTKIKEVLREKAIEEWSNNELREWRSKETTKYANEHPGWAKENAKISHTNFWKDKEIPKIKEIISENNLGELTSLNFNKAVLINSANLGNRKFAFYNSILEVSPEILNDFTKVDNDSVDYARALLVLDKLKENKSPVNVHTYNSVVVDMFEKPYGRDEITQGKGYRRAYKLFPELIKQYQAELNTNHTITKIEIVDVDKESVYCLEVDTPEHNFPLAAGIFAKNCEGLSPAGSLKSARKSTKYQSVVPLRGKVKNVKDSTADQAMDNKELFTIFKLIGLGIDVNNVTKGCKTPEEAYERIKQNSRYGKVIIATDSDEDGLSIQNGLLYAISKFARFMLDFGLIYIAESPVFIQNGKYFYPSDPRVLGTQFPVGLDVNKKYMHIKGLGSLDVQDVYNSFYNPATRRLFRVTTDGINFSMKLVEDIDFRKKLLFDKGILSNPYNFTDL